MLWLAKGDVVMQLKPGDTDKADRLHSSMQ